MNISKKRSSLKFSKWRPIGVCDKGPNSIKKAIIFSKNDLLKINSNKINRGNWKNSPYILEILDKYAKKLSKISIISNKMKNPTISNINLVGMVLGYKETPNLNFESKDGKVQLFQIEFIENKKKKKN